MSGRKWLKTAVFQPVELDEHVIPDLDDLWVIVIDKGGAGYQ